MLNNTINIPWKDGDSILDWNERCASVVEHFGLPGGRYTTSVGYQSMDFHFKNKKDAFLCQIMLSEYLTTT